MKRALLAIALLALCFAAFGHAAADIDARYTAKTKTLSIAFTHNVKDPSTHFIQGIQVRLNDVTIISQVASAQDTAEGGQFLYRVPNLKKGDVLDIILDCNKGGRNSRKMILN
ncbi:MAG TPA: hypothetical protein PLG20_09755 [Candidatus Syntrophosphaera sp.]|jgi:hypothetical protein|nr:hypothetical protein [Candidatus Syntrophosphaera sp.]